MSEYYWVLGDLEYQILWKIIEHKYSYKLSVKISRFLFIKEYAKRRIIYL